MPVELCRVTIDENRHQNNVFDITEAEANQHDSAVDEVIEKLLFDETVLVPRPHAVLRYNLDDALSSFFESEEAYEFMKTFILAIYPKSTDPKGRALECVLDKYVREVAETVVELREEDIEGSES